MVQMVLCIKNVPPPGTYVRTKPKCLHTHTHTHTHTHKHTHTLLHTYLLT